MSVPLSQLTSLDLLRGFVAVGRRMSITLAAQDLCVTQSAVSRQIRTLEDLLGVRLLTRGHRSIAFTAEGELLFSRANGVLQQLQDAIGEIRVGGTRQPVTITCTIGVAALWLLPRLGAFQALHPGIDVRISANDRVEDLRGDGIDLAIRYGAEKTMPDLAQRLFDEEIVPVVHPALEAPDAIERNCLLEFEGHGFPWLQWREWLAGREPKSMLRFNQYDQVIAAALAGQGIALGRVKLLEPTLAGGRLRALGQPRQTPYAYWLIRAKPKPRPDVVTTAEWISS